jgi:CopG family nickel-responsive transcriptional regulator
VAGAIVLVYDHHKKDVQVRSTEIQHDFHPLILSVQHVHLDHSNCLETIAVKGRASQLQSLADQLIALKGIKHGKLVMSTT